jgi:choline dehydrogenase-like flavoprotein
MRLGLPVANLPGAGAKRVEKVCIDRITGNRSRQRGTTRMEDDPAISALDRRRRTHEIENPYAVRGPFLTGTGANPTLTIMANAWRMADHAFEVRGAPAR